jgi:hypothetical protein
MMTIKCCPDPINHPNEDLNVRLNVYFPCIHQKKLPSENENIEIIPTQIDEAFCEQYLLKAAVAHPNNSHIAALLIQFLDKKKAFTYPIPAPLSVHEEDFFDLHE